MSEGLTKILEFKHFSRFFTFNMDGPDYKNKELKSGIKVCVAIDMECWNMSIRNADEMDTY